VQLSLAFRYVRYYLTAHGPQKVHSPFVFDLLTTVINNDKGYYIYEEVESVRTKLSASPDSIEVTDLGAGSKVFKRNKRPVSLLTKHTVKPKKYGQLLFRLVNHFQPKTVLELGTSLGVTSLYLAKANSATPVVTIEGCPNTAKYAGKIFEEQNATNLQQFVGDFAVQLPAALKHIETLDFVFFDGNHQEEPTLDYFQQCLPKANENTVFVFDDIHWSVGMEAAWKRIKAHPKVTITIDLFHIGLVFFRTGQQEEHFTLRH
jgi:predicted O-methyltransferase YrrM